MLPRKTSFEDNNYLSVLRDSFLFYFILKSPYSSCMVSFAILTKDKAEIQNKDRKNDTLIDVSKKSFVIITPIMIIKHVKVVKQYDSTIHTHKYNRKQ